VLARKLPAGGLCRVVLAIRECCQPLGVFAVAASTFVRAEGPLGTHEGELPMDLCSRKGAIARSRIAPRANSPASRYNTWPCGNEVRGSRSTARIDCHA
jgi:hypothetical protein